MWILGALQALMNPKSDHIGYIHAGTSDHSSTFGGQTVESFETCGCLDRKIRTYVFFFRLRHRPTRHARTQVRRRLKLRTRRSETRRLKEISNSHSIHEKDKIFSHHDLSSCVLQGVLLETQQ